MSNKIKNINQWEKKSERQEFSGGAAFSQFPFKKHEWWSAAYENPEEMIYRMQSGAITRAAGWTPNGPTNYDGSINIY